MIRYLLYYVYVLMLIYEVLLLVWHVSPLLLDAFEYFHYLDEPLRMLLRMHRIFQRIHLVVFVMGPHRINELLCRNESGNNKLEDVEN